MQSSFANTISGKPTPSPNRLNGDDRYKNSRSYFSAEQLANSPSRKAGITPDQEFYYRQMTACLIQDIGQGLQVAQLCINTAIVYMHRFYTVHSFTHYHRNGIAAATLFLATKVEEQPRKLKHVINATNKCLHQPTTSTTDSYYRKQAQELIFYENVLQQTLGFHVTIDHPHTYVIKTCQLVNVCKDVAKVSYFLASNSLHLTTMCLQYKPSVVACFCIYLACKWSRWEIPQSTEGKPWFHYVDETVTMDLLNRLTDEFNVLSAKSPTRIKSNLTSLKALAQGARYRQEQSKEMKAHHDWRAPDTIHIKMYHPVNTEMCNRLLCPSLPSQLYSPSNEQQQQQTCASVSQSMLPPAPDQPQQMRKPNLHSSSQHCSHDNSSSTSSRHSPIICYSPGDITDHKRNAGHGKPQYPQQQAPQPYDENSFVFNRHPRNHNSRSILTSSNNKSSYFSSSETSMSNYLPGPHMIQFSLQRHPNDVNCHESREHNMRVPPPPVYDMLSHGMSNKLKQNQDGSRSMPSKDHSSRLISEQYNNSQAQTQVTKLVNSLFSPDWNDPHQGQLQEPQIQQPQSSQSSSSYNRSSTSIADNGRSVAGHTPQQTPKFNVPNNLYKSLSSTLTGQNKLPGTISMGNLGGSGNKRQNESIYIEQDNEEVIRESKILKLDTSMSLLHINKHPVVNGIETNPDMVQNFSKKSLGSTSGLLQTELSIVTPSLQPPAELFESSATTSSSTNQYYMVTSSNNALSAISSVSAMETNEQSTSSNKSEERKQKDKHKG